MKLEIGTMSVRSIFNDADEDNLDNAGNRKYHGSPNWCNKV